MVQTQMGYAPELGIVEDCLNELHSQGRIEGQYDLVVSDPLIDSANASPKDWNWITSQIEKNYDNYNAFMITHGTDTLSFTTSALSFALEGLGKPVVVTGSMLPLTVQHNDGLGNLTDAMNAALRAEAGVWVQFAGQLLHGTRVRKSHSTAFDAFHASPTNLPPKRDGDSFRVQQFGEYDIPVLAVAPGMSGSVAEYCAARANGIVLRCYGSGTLPEIPGLYTALELAAKREIPVVAVSQCSEGGISLGTYAAGAILKDAGVIDGRDATVEASYAKLMYALSKFSTPKAQFEFLERSACGEFS